MGRSVGEVMGHTTKVLRYSPWVTGDYSLIQVHKMRDRLRGPLGLTLLVEPARKPSLKGSWTHTQYQ